MSKKNLFVLGLDDFHRELLEQLPQASEVQLHGLLTLEELKDPEQIAIRDLLAKATSQLESFEGSIDGIVGNWDFPVNVMTPLLRRRFGLPTPSLESILKCEHKHWSRLISHEVVPECVPAFEGFDPFDEQVAQRIHLTYPYWIKPVVAYASYLGFYIDDGEALTTALGHIRENIHRIAEPLTWVLEQVDMPPGVGGADGTRCLAEAIISGQQCTLEGFISGGEVTVFGVVDSLREANLSSFASYRYPSRLPGSVQERLIDATRAVVLHHGLDESGFNIEFFWDERTDRIWLLEINTRVSASHSDLFEKVDGASNESVMIDLALGRKPSMPHREGRFKVGAKFYLRRFSDALVTRIPGPDEITQIESDIPGARIKLRIAEGQRLSDRPDQDSYSYELAWIHLGADTNDELDHQFEECARRLRFEFEQIGERGGPQLAPTEDAE